MFRIPVRWSLLFIPEDGCLCIDPGLRIGGRWGGGPVHLAPNGTTPTLRQKLRMKGRVYVGAGEGAGVRGEVVEEWCKTNLYNLSLKLNNQTLLLLTLPALAPNQASFSGWSRSPPLPCSRCRQAPKAQCRSQPHPPPQLARSVSSPLGFSSSQDGSLEIYAKLWAREKRPWGGGAENGRKDEGGATGRCKGDLEG